MAPPTSRPGRPARTRGARTAAFAGLAVILAACGAASEAGGGRTPAPVTTASPTSPPAPQPTATPETASPTEEPDPGPVTIALAGDVHFEGPLQDRLDDPASALEPVAPLLSGADLAVVNLESSVGAGGTPEPKRFRFQAPPTALTALTAAGVDVVTMANNHVKDFGDDGFAQTLAAAADAETRNPPVSVVGVGADAAAAFAPAVREVRGTTVAVIGAHSADDPTADPTAHWAAAEDRPGVAVTTDGLEPLVDAVREVAANADVVVVFMHWGVQGESCPSESQRTTARALADAGATAVVGSHAHRLQGTGLLDATYVAYGLGNFVWYRPGPTGVLTLTVLDGRVVDETWVPAVIGEDGLPVPVRGAEAERLSTEFAGLRDCTDLSALG